MIRLFALSLILTAGIVFSCDTGGSESIRKEMSNVLNGSESSEMKLWRLESLNFNLAQAYIKENRPDEAIEILMDLIRKNREPHYIMGGSMKRSSAHYGMENIYYTTLAEAYTIKGDAINSGKATKKAADAAAMSDKLRPGEEKIEAAKKKKERDSILN